MPARVAAEKVEPAGPLIVSGSCCCVPALPFESVKLSEAGLVDTEPVDGGVVPPPPVPFTTVNAKFAVAILPQGSFTWTVKLNEPADTGVPATAYVRPSSALIDTPWGSAPPTSEYTEGALNGVAHPPAEFRIS